MDNMIFPSQFVLAAMLIASLFCGTKAFVPPTVTKSFYLLALSNGNDGPLPAQILGVSNEDSDYSRISEAMNMRGFQLIDSEDPQEIFVYRYKKATGLLQLISLPSNADPEDFPRWIPLVNDMESVLIKNGWSFLDPDESEPVSAYDIDAANSEGTYKPKWVEDEDMEVNSIFCLSSLGFDITPMSSVQVSENASLLSNEESRRTLLEGATDPSGKKISCNGISFSGPSGQGDFAPGIFICAIGSLPLFSSLDLSPTTASSGWLSFARPIADDHVLLVPAESNSRDKRVEVLCARSRCHLGHYFGSDGFCINASALLFLEISQRSHSSVVAPFSWRCLDKVDSSSHRQLKGFLKENCATKRIVLGAGCFWHVEVALRRLPGVVDTRVGFAGGITSQPTYDQVCRGDTGHAEVVLVEYDPEVLTSRKLIEAFFTLHDPTKVRAHGKHEIGTGQYRSMILCLDEQSAAIARQASSDCRLQLQKELSTDVQVLGSEISSWFFEADKRHQQGEEKDDDQKVDTGTIWASEWLDLYGKRSTPILGSSETINLGLATKK